MPNGEKTDSQAYLQVENIIKLFQGLEVNSIQIIVHLYFH